MQLEKYLTAVAAVGAVAMIPGIAEAAFLKSTFDIHIQTGALKDNVYDGSITYDDSFLGAYVLTGDQFSLEFNFLGETFTEEDDSIYRLDPSLPPVALLDSSNGEIIGLDYVIFIFKDDSPKDISFDVFGTAFLYYDNDSVFGEGILKPTGVKAIPEPLTMLGVGTAVGIGGILKRKCAKKA